MLLRLFIIFSLLTIDLALPAQTFWFDNTGSNGNDEALDVATDNSGNVIATGYFTQTVSFGAISLTTTSVSDVFIVKYDNAGNVLWAKKAGGVGADRGLSIRTDNAGNIYVTGYYASTATFGSTTLTTSGTQDVFITKLDASGNFKWARSVGGPDIDYGNGISVDLNGNVVVTGQYKATADFGSGFVFTSMNNTTTGLPTYDIFVLKLDSTGNTLWAKPAYAPYNDKGMDVDCDAGGNIYVCGQFSDTITIDVTHNNIALNAAFILKLSPAGNELEFLRMASGMTIAYSIDVDVNNNVNVCGDYIGTLVIGNFPSTIVPSTGSKNIFIVRVDPSLDVVWASHAGSTSEVTARSIATDPSANVYIAGMYKCRFKDYGNAYGSPTAFYSVGYRDVFAARYDAAGNYTWSKNCGGPKDDFCGGVAVSQDNFPVLAGGFNKYFNYIPASWGGGGGFGPCSWDGGYTTVAPDNAKDIFVGAFMDTTHTLINIFTSPVCTEIPDVIVNQPGPDTMHLCGAIPALGVSTEMIAPACYVGPCLEYTWHDGSTSATIAALTSGWYYVTVDREDNCYSNTDSVYISLETTPIPLITDSEGINIMKPPVTTPIKMCGNDTLTLAVNNVMMYGGFGGWTGSYPFTAINDSVIQVYSSGVYTFTNYNEYGCPKTNSINVQMDTFALDDTLHPFMLFFGQDIDSIKLCSNIKTLPVTLNDTIYYTGSIMPYKTVKWWVEPALPPLSPTSTSYVFCSISPFIVPNTWHVIHANLQNYCAEDTVNYWVHDSIYISYWPTVSISYTVTPGTYNCPDDTITHLFYSNAQTVTVSGTTDYEFYNSADSSITTAGNGTVYVNMSTIDTVSGCSATASANFVIPDLTSPMIMMSPPSGLVCPGDSVTLAVPPGFDTYQWYGPIPDSLSHTNVIETATPGTYYCVMTNANGCVVVSNTEETYEYGTPFVLVEPSNVFCEGESVTITAYTSTAAVISWVSPLSGSSTTQTVSNSGTYMCNITSCGITTVGTVSVLEISPEAIITASDLTLCEGDTIKLSANPLMMEYEWSPGGVYDTVLFVSEPGTYTLTVMDNGCYDNASVTVTADPYPADAFASDVSICPTNTATLTAAGAVGYNWYNSDTTFQGSGSPFTTPVLANDTVFFVQAINAEGCKGDFVPVDIVMLHDSLPELFFEFNCLGDDLHLFSDITVANGWYWSGPNSFTSTLDDPFVNDITLGDTGTYAMYYSSAPGCTSDTAFIDVDVLGLPTANIISNAFNYCEDDNGTFVAQTATGYSYTWHFANGASLPGNTVSLNVLASQDGDLVLEVTDSNGCKQYDTVSLIVIPLPIITFAVTPDVCVGQNIYLNATADHFTSNLIYGPDGFSTTQFVDTILTTGFNVGGLYTLVVSDSTCTDSMSLTVTVHDYPVVDLGPDTAVCPGAVLTFDLSTALTYTWYDNTHEAHKEVVDLEGVVWVTASNGSVCTTTDSLRIVYKDCNMLFPNIFTPNGDGTNDEFHILGEGVTNLQMTIFNRWGNEMFTTTDPYGAWDGIRSDGKKASEGVYFYVATVQNEVGTVREAKGHVQLSR
ncbi:MAG TPA: gliding motility-associated C-terminal domain-containing protein [Flavobacteriales bacterium]|nr:gliding motility-associated C-terminal domain-containing protein [Flavobacteriales bacterium]